MKLSHVIQGGQSCPEEIHISSSLQGFVNNIKEEHISKLLIPQRMGNLRDKSFIIKYTKRDSGRQNI